MSFQKTLLLLSIVIGLLVPSASTLKDQNPWNCFNFTLDESFFAQASTNWIEGHGYRMYGSKPFDPTITAGIPMAWGAGAIEKLTGEDTIRSGRVFVYFCFIILLLLVARHAYLREKNWMAVPLAIWIFSFFAKSFPQSGYFVFGFLAEAPGLVLGTLAYRALDQKKNAQAGLWAAFCFIMKPTFLFLLPAIIVVSFMRSFKRGVLATLAAGLTLSLYLVYVVHKRGESVLSYLRFYALEAHRIASDVVPGTFFHYYDTAGNTALLVTAVMATGGLLHILRFRKNSSDSPNAAFIVLFLGVSNYLITGRPPVEKQWSAVLTLVLVAFSINWAVYIASRFAGFFPKEIARAIILATVTTWIFSVGGNALHSFKHADEHACPSKEQSALNRELRILADRGDATRDNLNLVTNHTPFSNFLYRVGWQVPPVSDIHQLNRAKTKWIAGETKLLAPARLSCKPYWTGENFSLLKCL